MTVCVNENILISIETSTKKTEREFTVATDNSCNKTNISFKATERAAPYLNYNGG